MIGYLLFFFILIVLSQDISNAKNYMMMGVVIFLFCALRFEIGYDYLSYTNLMKNFSLHDTLYSVRMDELEPLSAYLLKLCVRLDPHLFFVISSAIIVGGFWYAIKKTSKYPIESLWLFIALPFFFMDSLSIVRNAMAYTCVFLAIVLYNDTKRGFLYKLLLIIIAYFFHTSGAIGLLIFFPWGKIKHSLLWGIFIASFLFGSSMISTVFKYVIFLGDYAFGQFDVYINGDLDLKGGEIMKYLILGLALLVLIFYKKIVYCGGEKFKYYVGLIVIGGSLYAAFIDFPHVAQRFCTYFYTPLLFVLPILFHSFKIKKKLIITGCLCMFILYLVNMHNGTMNKDGSSAVYPYKTIFER